MSEDKSIKLFTAAKELNIGTGTIVDFLATKGYKVQKHPMTQLDGDMYGALLKEFAVDKIIKEEAKQISIGKIRKDEPGHLPEKPVEYRRPRDFENEEILIKNTGHHYTAPSPVEKPKPAPQEPAKTDAHSDLPGVKVVGKINLDDLNAKPQPAGEKKEEVKEEAVESKPQPEIKAETPAAVVPEVKEPVVKSEEKISAPVAPPTGAEASAPAEQPEEDTEVIRAKAERLTGPNVVGRIQLPDNESKRNPVASSSNANSAADHKRKRKRKDQQGGNPQANHSNIQQANPPGTQQPHGGNRPDFRNRGNAPTGGGHGGGNRPDFRNRSASPSTPKPK